MSQPHLMSFALYLQRLGYDSAPPPTLATLRELQLRHTSTFAFESLSTLLRVPVPIDLASVEHKVLHEGRGGYCYELNQMYLVLLQYLGYEARGITGRVVMGGPEDAWPARTHRLVLLTLDGVRYVSDVGFGGMVPTAPLLLDTEDEQATPHEPYRITERDGSYTLRAKVVGEWRAMYVFDLQRQEAADYEMGNWFVSTHKDSPFLGQLKVALMGEGLRRTLNNGSYAVHRLGQDSERRQITDPDELIALLQNEFAIRVPQHPRLREVLGELLALPQPA
ncbi:arylamine N-acetyltransferase family protein [Pseudomonas chlororaphis subsp. aurantiaca]|uniref:arylamine N-acetyltransferase family protein n=1 Tax=Pseudomonas chlororaphis TaxID=587753 RepID=UPI000F58522A|nr:arylamine N-acetyltransferase [Pseudomonas chlororaphis]AZD53880.1 N-hydroxyarylamine O-acetyltransferase [Pseudomonas chlororaphis subsp. aurantiaca]AZD59981.1 N-hydroxyarylamine O-acetyltransferase [Pseudomonas chlororaphis subsp. aurantiaca]